MHTYQGFSQAFIATTVFSFELSFHAKAEGLCSRRWHEIAAGGLGGLQRFRFFCCFFK